MKPKDENAYRGLAKQQWQLLIAFIGFSLFAFLLVFIGVKAFLDQAFLELLGAPAWLPEMFPAFTLTQWHDTGIALASIGLVFMYLPITLTLVIVEQKATPSVQMRSRIIYFLSHSDFFNVIGFFGLFLSAGGVWFCMHQAFLYQGEFLKGTIPSNIYIFLIYEITPIILHLLGNLLIMIGLITIASIITIKVVIQLLSQLGWLE